MAGKSIEIIKIKLEKFGGYLVVLVCFLLVFSLIKSLIKISETKKAISDQKERVEKQKTENQRQGSAGNNFSKYFCHKVSNWVIEVKARLAIIACAADVVKLVVPSPKIDLPIFRMSLSLSLIK